MSCELVNLQHVCVKFEQHSLLLVNGSGQKHSCLAEAMCHTFVSSVQKAVWTLLVSTLLECNPGDSDHASAWAAHCRCFFWKKERQTCSKCVRSLASWCLPIVVDSASAQTMMASMIPEQQCTQPEEWESQQQEQQQEELHWVHAWNMEMSGWWDDWNKSSDCG